MRIPDVELLWWEGCPSTPQALAELREALRASGLADVEVRMREIKTDTDALETEFVGSPTIRVDGADIAPPDAAPMGLTCRIYRRRDGRISPVPDPDDVREALERAARGEEGS